MDSATYGVASHDPAISELNAMFYLINTIGGSLLDWQNADPLIVKAALAWCEGSNTSRRISNAQQKAQMTAQRNKGRRR